MLNDYGHKKIAFIGEKLTSSRANLYKKVMLDNLNQNINVIISDYRFEKAGEDGIEKLLSSNKDCTAIICAYDNIAFGAIKRLAMHGINVPDDISIIGIDNISAAKYNNPTLTSISTNPEEVCLIVWNLLQKKIANPFFKSKQRVLIESNLVIRDSIKNINSNNEN